MFERNKEYGFEQEHAALQALVAVLTHGAGSYFLIGGQARDLFLHRRKLTPPAVTRDIDFAVMCDGTENWEELVRSLVAAGFRETSLPYRFTWGKTPIDLIPFGGMAQKEEVFFAADRSAVSVSGFLEVNQFLEHQELAGQNPISIPIAPLSGIFMLKLLAWDDRPERYKDIQDMSLILWNYWGYVEEEFFDFHYELAEIPDSETWHWGARILGRHIGQMLLKSPGLHQRICGILEGQVARDEFQSPFLLGCIRNTHDEFGTLEEAKRMLSEVLMGIKENWRKSPLPIIGET